MDLGQMEKNEIEEAASLFLMRVMPKIRGPSGNILCQNDEAKCAEMI
jgi:hypothetical protein